VSYTNICSDLSVIATTSAIMSHWITNLTPADVYYGGQEVLDQRHIIKLDTLAMCRKMHYDNQHNLPLVS
jgi:hypothetical protein